MGRFVSRDLLELHDYSSYEGLTYTESTLLLFLSLTVTLQNFDVKNMATVYPTWTVIGKCMLMFLYIGIFFLFYWGCK